MSLDDHCFTTLILCNISKAFDRVFHTGLLLKLKAYGIDGKLSKWFESYISSRTQCVFLNNSKSLHSKCRSSIGVSALSSTFPIIC